MQRPPGRPATATALAVCLLLLGAPVAASAGGAGVPAGTPLSAPTGDTAPSTAPSAAPSLSPAATGPGSRNLVRTTTLSLTPGRPGSVNVTVRYDTPPNLETLTVGIRDARDVTLDGFERTGEGTYEWTGASDPVVRFTFAVNRTTESRRAPRGLPGNVTDAGTRARDDAPSAEPGGFAFVDAGPWAVVPVPSLRTRWSWTGTEVSLVRRTRVDGSGAAADGIAYLGPGEVYERTVADQRIRLAVPARAEDDMAAEPRRVLDALGEASADLRVGDRDETVLIIAAPTEVNWGPRGVARGDAAAWVAADAPLRSPSNVWFHEYVHTRQSFTPAPSAHWLIEGTANYYAAALSLRAGLVDFGDFRSYLEQGSAPHFADDVLADPATWTVLTPYLKGMLVAGELDRRTRLATESRQTLDDVVERLTERAARDPAATVDASRFLAAVELVAGEEVRSDARRYTMTAATPEAWSLREHRRAFGTAPPRMEYELGADGRAAVLVTGRIRTEAFEAVPPLAVGETLVVNATVTNTGGATGTYRARLRANDSDSVVAAATGELAPGESAVVTLRYTFRDPGTYDLALGGVRDRVRVRPVPDPEVVAVRVPEEARPGEPVAVRAVLRNDADVPARGEVPVLVDGRRVGTPNATVPAGGRATVGLNVTFDGPGAHTVRVGNRSASVTVDATETPVPGLGNGPLPGIAALALLLVLAVRRLGGGGGDGDGRADG